MGYRRFRRPLPLVASRSSPVARPTVNGQPSTMGGRRTADGDRRSSPGVSKSRYAYFTYFTYLFTYPTENGFSDQVHRLKRKENRQPSTVDRASEQPCGGRRSAVGGRRSADGGQRSADGGRLIVARRWHQVVGR